MRIVICFVVYLLSSAISVFAQGNSPVIQGNTPGAIRKAMDQGLADASAVISINVWLKLHNEQQLDTLVSNRSKRGRPTTSRGSRRRSSTPITVRHSKRSMLFPTFYQRT